MAVSFRLYRLENSDEINDVAIVDDASDDIVVEEMSDIEETLEIEEAKFRLSNVDVSVSGLTKAGGDHRMEGADSVVSPWVFEVQENNSVRFTGLVDPDSITYNASTERTSFTVLSFLEILDSVGNIPARYKYETELRKVWPTDPNTYFCFLLNTFDDVGSVGDILRFEKEGIEFRFPITATKDSLNPEVTDYNPDRDDSFGPFLFIPNPGTRNQLPPSLVDGTANDEVVFIEVNEVQVVQGTRNVTRYDYNYYINKNSDFGELLMNRYLADTPEGEAKDLPPGEEISLEVVDPNNDFPLFLRRLETKSLKNVEDFIFLKSNRTQDQYITGGFFPYENASIQMRASEILTQLELGDEIELIGNRKWGYAPPNPLANYKLKGVLKGIFTVPDMAFSDSRLGVIRNLFDTAAFDDNNWDVRDIRLDKEVEYPASPLKALRLIQNTTKILLRERFGTRTTANGDVVPSFWLEIKERDKLFDTATAPNSGERIQSWEEKVSSNPLRAVVVRPNKEYLKRKDRENVGFYFQGIEQYEQQTEEARQARNETTIPEGDRVLEIEVAKIPRYGDTPSESSPDDESGYIYGGDGKSVRNDPVFKKLAKFYFEHFSKIDKEVEFSVGRRDLPWLGEYRHFQIGSEIDDFVFITKKSSSLRRDSFTTTFEGRIGEPVPTEFEDPVAIILGRNEFYGDGSDTVPIFLDGSSSYSPQSDALSLFWEYREAGDTTWNAFPSEDQSPVLDSSLTLPSDVERIGYEVRLTVSSPEDVNDGIYTKNILIERTAPDEGFIDSTELNFDKSITVIGSDQYGYIAIKPTAETSIDTIEVRKQSGGEIKDGAPFSLMNQYTGESDNPPVPTDLEPPYYWERVLLRTIHNSTIEVKANFVRKVLEKDVKQTFTFDRALQPGIEDFFIDNWELDPDPDSDEDLFFYEVTFKFYPNEDVGQVKIEYRVPWIGDPDPPYSEVEGSPITSVNNNELNTFTTDIQSPVSSGSIQTRAIPIADL